MLCKSSKRGNDLPFWTPLLSPDADVGTKWHLNGFFFLLLMALISLPVVCSAEGGNIHQVPAEKDSVSLAPSTEDSSLVSCISPDVSTRVAVYRLTSQAQSLRLPDRNIFVGSEQVKIDGDVLPKGSYFIDCAKGELFLRDLQPAGREISVEYRFLPFYLRESYFLRPRGSREGFMEATSGSLSQAGSRAALDKTVLGEQGSRSSSGGLRLSGTKTFSLEIGSNRDATLKQSLDMNVTGEIAKGVGLTAVLTDRDLPIQPEGRTETISQLDEIRVELQSQSFKAALGDCYFTQNGGSLLNVSRKLEGAQARGTFRGMDLVVAGSTLKGKWTTRDFTGTEGKQGAYELLTDEGSPCVVIAGTEKVWLDGIKLRRGESADYWIDYGSGNLYFTNRRPITGYSRISIEYEYATGDFQKNFYAAGIGTNLKGQSGRLEFLFVSEADQKGLEIGSLSEEERLMLGGLGDAPANGTVEGAVYVGNGQGDYELISDGSAGANYFKFCGQGKGAYHVSFVNLGRNNGAYFSSIDSTGEIYYAYAGPGKADYNPGRRLVAPASKKVEDLRAIFSAGGLDFSSEFALSQNDLNTLSSIDDGDNLGKAGIFSLKSRSRGMSLGNVSLGRVSFEGSVRSIDEEFSTFGSINAPFEYESWALSDTSFSRHGEKRFEARADYSPWQSVTLSAQHGQLFSSSGLAAKRNIYSIEHSGRLSISGRMESAASETGSPGQSGSSRNVKSVGTRLTGWRVVPSVSYYSETRENADAPGTIAEEYATALASGWKLPLSVRIEEKCRIEYIGTSANRARSYDAITHLLGLELNRWRSLSASCEYSVRDLNGYNGVESRKTELGKFFVSQNTGSGRISYEINHLVTTLNTESSTKNIIYVGQEAGRYDSTGTFTGRGDYEVQIIDLGTSSLSADATTSATLAIRPFKGMGKETPLKAALESLGSSSFFRSSGTLRGASRPFSLLFSPMYTESPDAVRSNGLVREELEIASPSKRVALRYRYELTRNLFHQYENVLEKSTEARQGMRLRTEPGRGFTLELEQAWRDRGRDLLVDGGFATSGRAVGTETIFDLRYLPVRAVELAVLGSLSGLRDTDTQSSVRVSKLSPSATYGAGGSTRARLMVTFASYGGDTGVLAVGTAGAFVSPNRLEIVFSLDHSAGQHLTISTNVSSRQSNETFVTDGRVEVRAHF